MLTKKCLNKLKFSNKHKIKFIKFLFAFYGFNLFIKRIGKFINHIMTLFFNFMLIYEFNLAFN
jgi:hypothetical protein